MYAQVEKSKENTTSADRRKIKAVVNSVTQKKSNGKQGFRFVDNRPKVVFQRQVRNFSTSNSSYDTPGEQFKKLAKSGSDINATHTQIDNKVDTIFSSKYANYKRVKNVVATVKSGRPNGKGTGTSDTREVGELGRDDMIARRDYRDLGFEGGHLISAALWDANDFQVNHMNAFGNLVPMSRGMNIYTYMNKIEKEMDYHSWRKWTLTPTFGKYDIREKHIAEVLNLPLIPGKSGDATATMDSWIPDSVTGSKTGFTITAEESGVYDAARMVDTGAQLIALLKEHNLENALTEDLLKDIAKKL